MNTLKVTAGVRTGREHLQEIQTLPNSHPPRSIYATQCLIPARKGLTNRQTGSRPEEEYTDKGISTDR